MYGSKVRIKDSGDVYPDQIGLEGIIVDVIDWHEVMLYRVYFSDKGYDDKFSTLDFDVLVHSTLRDTLDDETINQMEQDGCEIDLDL